MADALMKFLEGYLRAASQRVMEMAARGEGREVLGSVPGRPETEDQELGIDRACDDLLDEWCRKSGLAIEVHSEHGVRRPYEGGGAPQYVITIDPFDGTGLYKRRLPAEWWIVLSLFEADGLKPVAAGAVDILRGEVYLASPEGVHLDGRGAVFEGIKPSAIRALADGPVIAAFLMDPTYLTGWTAKAKRLLDTFVRDYPGVRIWPNGGSCVYPWLARGLVQAYLMFDEPRSEIDPGVGFAELAGLQLFSVSSVGEMTLYRMDLSVKGAREPFFVAACTEELARAVVRAVVHGPGKG